MEQTLLDYCFDAALHMKIVYRIWVMIWAPFLASFGKKRGYFNGVKKAIFATRGKKTHFWNKKTWSNMEQALRDCVFWYYLQMKMIYSGLVMILGPFLAFYGQKKVYFCHQRHKILNFQTVNVVKNGETLLDYVIWYCPLD